MTQDNKQIESKETENKKPDQSGVMIEGHIKIFDPESGEVMVDKRNAIHYENMSQSLANSLANKTTGFVHEMAFGNGGTSVDPTGVITYLTPNSTGTNASLYNQTYYKVIDDNSATNKVLLAYNFGFWRIWELLDGLGLTPPWVHIQEENRYEVNKI